MTQDTGTPNGGTPDQQPPSDPQGGNPANREAAQFRRERNEWRARAETAEARVERYERQEVEGIAGERLRDPSDFWSAGVGLDALRNDDGVIDPDMVEARVIDLVQAKPHFEKPPASAQPKPTPTPTPSPTSIHAGARPEAPAVPSFGQSIKDAARG